jgi:hypothetical protein
MCNGRKLIRGQEKLESTGCSSFEEGSVRDALHCLLWGGGRTERGNKKGGMYNGRKLIIAQEKLESTGYSSFEEGSLRDALHCLLWGVGRTERGSKKGGKEKTKRRKMKK